MEEQLGQLEFEALNLGHAKKKTKKNLNQAVAAIVTILCVKFCPDKGF